MPSAAILAVAAEVAVAQIVGKDKDDIRRLSFRHSRPVFACTAGQQRRDSRRSGGEAGNFEKIPSSKSGTFCCSIAHKDNYGK
jgi:hypothetical protein